MVCFDFQPEIPKIGGENEKPTNGVNNGPMKHQYTNSVEMDEKEIITNKDKDEKPKNGLNESTQ